MRRDPHRRARAGRARSASSSRWPAARRPTWRKGFLAGHLRRRGPLRRRRSADPQHRPDDHRLDARVPAAARIPIPSSRTDGATNGCAVVRVRGGLSGAAAVLPPDGPGDHAQALDRGPRAQVATPSSRVVVDRAARHASCRCTTSRPAPATSSPTASSATTASPAPRTSTSTSTRGATSRSEIVVKVNVPEVLRAELARPSWKGEHGRAGDEHRPVPVGRGPLQADARDLGGAARLRATRARSSPSRRCCCATWTC